MTTKYSLDEVCAIARRVIGTDHASDDDTRVLHTIGAMVDPEIVRLDGRPLAVHFLKLIAPAFGPKVTTVDAVVSIPAAEAIARDRGDIAKLKRWRGGR